MAKELAELQADLQAVNREREALHSKAKKLTEKIDPLLEQAEAERRAHPSTEGEAQGVG
ncbi:MAG: hypothetical protein IID07_11930 [Gemmatimonadetes bacterium]|nr:hypothetical protein [Gemmatimonadota bacterium]